MVSISPIPAFQDNYIWSIEDRELGCAYVVDPGDAKVVEDYLRSHKLELHGILITHHHWDHTGGVEALIAEREIPVYGPHNPQIPSITQPLKAQDQLQLKSLPLKLSILEVPGHTLDHIAYYGNDMLFCGDTLFSGGCGRLFEGSPAQMQGSLDQLSALPDQTLVYCTHEYTQANLKFAQHVDADNAELMAYKTEVDKLRQAGKISLPSQIKRERDINPFLRCDYAALIHSAQTLGNTTSSDRLAVFTSLRQLKDQF